MAIIKSLDAHLTNMIAAGEVVDRPMGIVKELMENSIDAKATRIDVVVFDGGLKVVDNGCGMDSTDALMAFQRHATSKISHPADLWRIQTMGFRGEALPSIASVSEVVLLTNDGNESTKVSIRYGEVVEHCPFGCEHGTSIEVRNLFYKLPARLKHLKTPQYELSLITDCVSKFALAYPTIAFSLIHEDRELFKCSGMGDVKEVLYQLYGSDIAKNTIEFHGSDFDFNVSGYAVLPQYNRSNRYSITLFLNNRLVRHFKLSKAIIDGYGSYLMDNRYPIVVCNITMDAQLIDVNVHPSKMEVRLSKEKQLETLVSDCISQTLRQQMEAPTIKKTETFMEKVEQVALFEPTTMRQWKQDVDYSRFVQEKPRVVYEEKKESVVEQQIVQQEEIKDNNFQPLRYIGQLHGSYLCCESVDGLVLVDQHAAMERVNFEKVSDLLNRSSVMLPLLYPISCHVDRGVFSRLSEFNELMQEVPLHAEIFGDDVWIVREIPAWMELMEPQRIFSDYIEAFKQGELLSNQKVMKDKLASIACKQSIKFNHSLTSVEATHLIEQLSRCQQPFNCPHGRPTLVSLPMSQLIKEFKR